MFQGHPGGHTAHRQRYFHRCTDEKTRQHAKFIIDLVREFGIDEQTTSFSKEIDDFIIQELLVQGATAPDEVTEILKKEIKKSVKKCIALQVCQHVISLVEKHRLQICNTHEFMLASVTVCIFWNPMLEKRISRQVVEDVVSYFYIMARIAAYSVIDHKTNKFWKRLVAKKASNLTASFTGNVFRILFNRAPMESELVELKYLLGLTITNGPGTLSAKGAKVSVSARNHISMSYIGFLAATGLAHGGNGFEAVEYLLENFKSVNLQNPGQKNTIDLKALANKAAKTYREYKLHAKESRGQNYARIPCINHPIFKDNDINIDPREAFFATSRFQNLFVLWERRCSIGSDLGRSAYHSAQQKEQKYQVLNLLNNDFLLL